MAELTGQSGDANGFIGIARAGSVGQQCYILGDIIENIGSAAGIYAAQCQSYNLSFGLFNGSADKFQ